MVSKPSEMTSELLLEANKSILYTAKRPEIVMDRGEGMNLWDTDGKKYLDFIGGWAVTCLGHSPKVITRALMEQSSRLVNASPTFYNKPMIQFAKMLTETSCFNRVFFATNGAEANEGAIKLARKYGAKCLNGDYEIITTENSFHGRTLATMSATGKKQWNDLFAPKVPGFIHVPFNDIDSVIANINTKTCAVMLEPVQGEGGVFAADQDYIQNLRRICDEKNILLIFDEVQTGFGRTGTLYAYEHYGVEPDIMTLAKGIGGGFPLAAMLAKETLNIFDAGDQGGTYSSQPLAMAVGIAVLNEILNGNILENVQIQGEYIFKKLLAIKQKYGLERIRGMGLLIAFDLPEEKGPEIVSACLDEGLIVNSPRPSIIRLMPPLIVAQEDIDAMFIILIKVFDKIFKK